MAIRSAYVGRPAERERLGRALERARLGSGAVVLLSGEAGVGKTRIAEDLAAGSRVRVLAGRAEHGAAAPYGPVVAALRSHLRWRPDALDGCGPLRPHLALILPELGEPAEVSDRATLHEAVRAGLAHLAAEEPALVILDDLQWSDDATLELLRSLAGPLAQMPMLVIAGYRSDGLARDHTLRRLRHQLRRDGLLDELALAPLGAAETAELATHILGGAPAPSLAEAILDRTHGVPFFVEELSRALVASNALTQGPRGLELADEGHVPVPETIRDAVLMGAAELSREARAAAEAAAVAGETFDLDLVGGVSSGAGLAELVERGLVAEDGRGRGAFRHALTQEALYADVPWLERRALHRRVAEALEEGRGTSMEIATQWLGARDEARARDALLRAAAEWRAVHAHRDAARAGLQALELWPAGDEPERRIEALEDYAGSAELCGEMAEAGRAWREIVAVAGEVGAHQQLAGAQRRLAAIHDLKGDRETAAEVRRAAAETYAAAGHPAEAAVERLVIADYLTADGRHSAAIALAETAGAEAVLAERLDLRARSLGLEGMARARLGDGTGGIRAVHSGLGLALEHGLTSVAAELYQRLSVALYNTADYRRAETTLATALDLCRAVDAPETELNCTICLIYVLRESGEWPRAAALAEQQIASGVEPWLGEGLVGAIHAFQGRFRTAQRLLGASLAVSSQVGHFPLYVESTAALAWMAAAEGADDDAARLCRAVLERWEQSEDHHYAVRALRWAAGFLARRGDMEGAHACAAALTRIVSESGHGDALAALAHAIGETALADGEPAIAAEQLSRAVELHRGLDIPFERAEIELRAGAALAAAGEGRRALEHLRSAHRTARSLGARPLAVEAAREIAALDGGGVRRLGRREAADAEGAGLSRRELQVVRLVGSGRTNREIAEQLVLSPRTVDMHVRNLLRKLDCRSRLEAARRAGELGLLV